MTIAAPRLLAIALIAAALAGMRAGARPHPSVILIVIDTLRADHLGCYGYARPTSPGLDALARTGTRFTHAVATSSWTAASVASILTASYPAEHGVESSGTTLGPALPTIAEAFARAGYMTAAFSANPAYVTPEMGFARGFQHFAVLHGPDATPEGRDVVPADAALQHYVEVATAEHVTDAVLSWLEHDWDGKRPFFVYAHYFDPHADYRPPAEYAARFGVAPDARLAGPEQGPFLRKFKAPDDPADLATLVGLYDGEIAFTDHEIGRLLAGVRARGVAPLLAVTADHGEELGDHGGLFHGITLWQEQLHVPLIVAGPSVPPGVVVDTPRSLVSVWPLLADATGVPGPRGGHRDGSLLFADLERPHPGMPRNVHRHAVIEGDWKLLETPEGVTSMYDLAADPGEHRDLGGSEEVRRRELEVRLAERGREAARIVRIPGAALEITSERRARLRALGYAE